MKKIIIIIFVFFVAYVIYYYQHRQKPINSELQLYGNVEIRQVNLGFRVEGRIQKLFYEEGDYVKKGSIVARLDSTNYRANYEKSLADIDMNRHINANASRKLARNIPLCEEGTVSKQDCDDF